MRCIRPVSVGNRSVPCGKCNFCLAVRRADWCFRLEQELKVACAADFITLTYSDEKLPVVNEDAEYFPSGNLCKRDVQLFLKRLRKRQAALVRERGKFVCSSMGHSVVLPDWIRNLRYYLVGEYGSKSERAHYHLLIFNLLREILVEVPEIWNNGHVYRGEVNGASINYVAKFHVNAVKAPEGRQKEFALISNRSGGIGMNYLDCESWHRADMANYVMTQGRVRRLPRYYKNRFFSPDELDGLRREMEESSREKMLEFWKEWDARYPGELVIGDLVRSDAEYQYSKAVKIAHDALKSKSGFRNL